MKIQLFVLSCSLLFASCDFTRDKQVVDKDGGDQGGFRDQLVAERDISIDSTSAYNNMFADSLAVDQFITKNKLIATDSQAVKGFYNLRNYQFAWFAPDGLTEQGRSFWNAYTYARSHGQKDTLPDKAFTAWMDKILDIDTLVIGANDSTFIENEIALTHRFIRYYRNSDPQTLLRQLPLTHLIPARNADPIALADSVLSFNNIHFPDTGYHPYVALTKQLALFDSIAKQGGWLPIEGFAGMLLKGTNSPVVKALKTRLQFTGDYMKADSSSIFNDSLELAMKSYQQRNGFRPDGIVTDSLVMAMNVPVEQRIRQVLVNMNRIAWIPPQVKDHFVAVNIPDFMLEVHEGDSIPLRMEVIVGKEGSNTMMFSGDLNQVVFSPAWNIPASIVEKEILPAMKNDPGYLKSRKMEVVRRNDTLPEIRQLPGPGNSMGQVKFLFPNSYDIYLHDTEAKGLFSQKTRAFSHGCIRLADAKSMSEYILRNNDNWTTEKIRAAMNSNKEQFIAVKQPIPVVITYFTTWVGEDGKLNFRDDIYQHDKRTADMMFRS